MNFKFIISILSLISTTSIFGGNSEPDIQQKALTDNAEFIKQKNYGEILQHALPSLCENHFQLEEAFQLTHFLITNPPKNAETFFSGTQTFILQDIIIDGLKFYAPNAKVELDEIKCDLAQLSPKEAKVYEFNQIAAILQNYVDISNENHTLLRECGL